MYHQSLTPIWKQQPAATDSVWMLLWMNSFHPCLETRGPTQRDENWKETVNDKSRLTIFALLLSGADLPLKQATWKHKWKTMIRLQDDITDGPGPFPNRKRQYDWWKQPRTLTCYLNFFPCPTGEVKSCPISTLNIWCQAGRKSVPFLQVGDPSNNRSQGGFSTSSGNTGNSNKLTLKSLSNTNRRFDALMYEVYCSTSALPICYKVWTQKNFNSFFTTVWISIF